MRRVGPSTWVALIAVLLVAAGAAAQEPIDEMAIFEPLLGSAWAGRFQDSSAPQVDHVVEWNTILDGQVVRWSKRVDALGFEMETTFYWDRELAVVTFVQLASSGVHGQGTAWMEEGRLVLSGVSGQTSGAVEFRQTFEILADGTLEDRYFRRAGDAWAPQHVIVYDRVRKEDHE